MPLWALALKNRLEMDVGRTALVLLDRVTEVEWFLQPVWCLLKVRNDTPQEKINLAGLDC